MITLKIENEQIESIFLNEFHSNTEKFLEFIQSSFEKIRATEYKDNTDFISLQESSMAKTWDNSEDEVWNEL